MTDKLQDIRDLDLPFDIDEVDSQCHKCVREQLEKYQNHVDSEGRPVRGKFLVPCDGIKKHIIDPALRNQLTDEQIEEVEAVNNIAAFAKKYLKTVKGESWDARWYQKDVLRCLPGDQMVFMADGTVKQIDEIKINDKVLSYHEIKRETSACKVVNVFDQGIKDVYRITLKNGDTLECTDNHPILSHYKGGKLNKLHNVPSYKTDYRSIKDGLLIDSKVYVLNTFDKYGNNNNNDIAKILGYFVTDGWVSNNKNNRVHSAHFANTNKKYTDEFFMLLKSTFPNSDPRKYFKESKTGKDGIKRKQVYTVSVYGLDNQFIKFLTDTVQCVSKHNKEISILKYAFTFSKKALVCFINRCWSGDGCVYSNKKRISLRLASGNYNYLKLYRLLLKKIGIYNSSIYKDKKDPKSKGVSIDIHRATDIICFFDNINYIYGKEEQSKKVIIKAKEVLEPKETSLPHINYKVIQGANLKGKMRTSARVKIKNIEYVGKKKVYDIEVDRRHNFIAQGLIVHNCTSKRKVLRISRRTGKTDSVCVEICYYLFTNKNFKILVVGPQKTHTEEIITRIRAFIKNNPLLRDAVVRDVSAPYYEIKLQNGSRLRGFAGGTKGNESVAIRGQDADRIYIEEMDYVDKNAIQGAIYPILFTTPDTALIGFSTPSGFRTPYYDLCVKSPQYKEFHYTYKVLPWWRNVEAERGNFTEEQWTHEQLAEFGTSESGVYKPSYIDRSLQEYQYSDIRRQATWKYTIGTDWNEKYGTEIVVLGYDPFSTLFKVVETVHIERSEFTQLMGVTKLIELNKKWRPDFIYIDAGNGCLHADSLVSTENGSKLIKEIKVGDKVLTYNGEYKSVYSTVCTGTKESYLIKPTFCLPTIASKKHLHVVYSSNNKFNDFPKNNIKWSLKSTNELDTNKDFFVIPKQNTSKMKTSCIIDLANELKEVDNLEYDENYIWTKHGYLTDQQLSVSQIVKEFNTSRPTVQRTRRKIKSGASMSPAEKELYSKLNKKYGNSWIAPQLKKTERYINICDSEFLYIYGWFLSEGSIGENSIEISQMPHHFQKEFAKLITYCKKRWDVNILVRQSGKQKGMKRLFIQNSLINKLFEKIGGKYCYNKFIDKRIMKCNPIELLPSLFYGDGHIRNYGVDISLTSFKLVDQVRQILVNNKLLAGIHKVNSRKRKDGYNDSLPQLMLYLNAKDNTVDRINNLLEINIKSRGGIQRRKYIETDKYFLVPIRKIKYIGKYNNMYDLTVEDNASFCVNGFITHNSTNYELLRKTAFDNNTHGGNRDTARLLTTLKKYDAGAAIEIRDPVSRQKRKSPAKSFMVNASVRMFEQNKIRLSIFDLKLDNQLRNYVIERYTPTGNPVYGLNNEKVGDHRLDALNLAIVAFQLEFNDLHATNVMVDVAIAPHPRSNKSNGYDTIDSNRPTSRDIDGGGIKNDFEKQLFPMTPSHIDNGLQGIKTNRRGWSTDEEELHVQNFIQRRRSRNRFIKNRPSRTKF